MVKPLIDNIELWLSAAGIAVILLVPTVLIDAGENRWPATAITAILVGVLHGVIFWATRRRQRRIRSQAINEIRRMLQDRINNELAVVLLNLSAAHPTPDRVRLARVDTSLRRVVMLLDSLSEESLRDWKARYAHLTERSEDPPLRTPPG